MSRVIDVSARVVNAGAHSCCARDRQTVLEGISLRWVAPHPGSASTGLTQMTRPEGGIGCALNCASSALVSMVLLHRKHVAQIVVMCASKSSLQGGSDYECCRIAKPSAQGRQESEPRELRGLSDDWVETRAKLRDE